MSDFCVLTEALKEVADIATQLQSSLIRLENFQKLTELQRDLIGIENLTTPGRVSSVSWSRGMGSMRMNLIKNPRLSGVHTRGLSVQAHQKRATAKDVFSGELKSLFMFKQYGKSWNRSLHGVIHLTSTCFSVLRHAPLHKQRCNSNQSV